MSDTPHRSRRRFLWQSLGLLGLGSACRPMAPPMPTNEAAHVAPPPAAAGGGQQFPRGWNPDVSFRGDPSRLGQITYRNGSRALPYVALTFDDGPHGTNTPRLMDILRSRNVKATFYVLGPRVRSQTSVMSRMVSEGHEVGNHSWTHRNMSQLNDGVVLKEFQDTHQAVIDATGIAPKTQRPPYGAMTTAQRAMLRERLGYPCIMWDVDPQDWRRPGSSVVSSRILSDTRNGSIIILHDIHAPSVDAVPAVLDGLISRGFTFVTVSQLLSMG